MCFGVSCLYHKGINAACYNFQGTFFLSYIVCGGYSFDVLGCLDKIYASIAADFVFDVALGTQLNQFCLDGRYLSRMKLACTMSRFFYLDGCCFMGD